MVPRRFPLIFGCLALVGCAGGESDDGPLGQAQEFGTCAAGATTKGVDISHYQPNTNWATYAGTGRDFAFVKATEGTSYKDPDFNANWAGMKANNIVRGAYHFFHPSDDPIAQADFFTSTVGPLGDGDIGLALDLEVTDGMSDATVASTAKAFLARVQQNSGKTPIVYVSPGFFSGIGNPSGFSQYRLWVANWGVSCPTLPNGGWTTWTFWQDSDNGSVSGVNGAVDTDKFNGSDADLRALAGSKPEPAIAQVNGNDGLTLVNWANNGHAELFLKTPGGDVVHTYSSGTTDDWTAPAKLDSGIECGFGSVMWPAPYSYAEVVAPLSPKGNVGHLWWANGWNTFHDLGGTSLGHVSTVIWEDTHAELFAVGGDGAVYHNYFVFSQSDWSGWSSMGGTNLVTGAAPIRWDDGHVELFATDADGVAWHNWSGNYQGGWHGWDSLGGALASRPVPVRWADGHVEVFARGMDGHLYHTYYSSGWQPWSVIDASTTIEGEPSATVNGNNNGGVDGPEVFARRNDGKVVHLWWDGSNWTSFTKLGDQDAGGDPFVWARTDNVAEVFVIDPQGNLMRSYHDPKNGWQAWASIASGPFDTCAPPPDNPPGTGGAGGSGGAGGGASASSSSASSGSALGGAGGEGGGAVNGGVPGQAGGCACRAGERGEEGGAAVFAALALASALARRRRSNRALARRRSA
jgi:lysozyme